MAQVLNTFNGRIIANYYKVHGILDNKARNSLTNLLIENEYQRYVTKNLPFKLNKEIMEEIMDEIKQCFKNEPDNVYYIPYNAKQRMSGKLWMCYNNFKKKMKLTAPRVSKAPMRNVDPISFNLIKVKTRPNETFYQHWNETVEHRLKTVNNIKDYFNMYPALNQNTGYKLIEMDYNFLHPNTNNFELEWNKIYESIWKIGIDRQIEEIPICKDLKIASLLLLPFLIPPVWVAFKGKRIKYTKTEVQDGFIVHYKVTSFVTTYYHLSDLYN